MIISAPPDVKRSSVSGSSVGLGSRIKSVFGSKKKLNV
jgi:hypothetical protein